MAIELKLPELGGNIESADVVSVLVKEGDKIQKDQGLFEIETDKATIEVPSTQDGVVQKILIKAGDKIKVGQTVLMIEESVSAEVKTIIKKEGGVPAKTISPKEIITKEIVTQKTSAESISKVVEVTLPDLGENIESADVVTVLVNPGDKVEKDQGIIEIETDKATVEVPSPASGEVVDVLIKPGTKAKVGETLIKLKILEDSQITKVKEIITELKTDSQLRAATEVRVETTTPEVRAVEISGQGYHQPPITKGSAPAAPSVRRIAREIGIDINEVLGTGIGGRILMDDVKAYAKKLNEQRGKGISLGFGIKAEKLPDFSKFGSIEIKPMNNIRTKTAEHLSYAWATIPHVTQFDQADITVLEMTRKAFNPKIEKAGGKLTITSFLLKISAAALKTFPQFNSSIDMEKKYIIYKNYFNIGVAVDTEFGLIVPVIKNVDQKNLTELSVELATISEKARNKKISLEELQGGCFTITNLGGIGGTSFAPIVNSPEVAILGVSRGSYKPVYKDGRFEPRMVVPLSLSYDHRIIDGADAARFLRWVCEALEQPMKLLLD
ncbi:MAG: branched-chain alpha-keto acid dehydrogenase subunit E2 [Ignavibacteria bacterium RIFOXYB2_FULL_35_12]|nr:MAG: branched-chain alpha-keto acid dehydrogenase subunit E2 [Ignavibacteria bacterium GWF2_35_20]OGU78993.1 MAG: branched-chain alpha-keto acid dehydrogenase subunit E2 [Ignavibacteria bacterium RIFOXYA2_FULL_35_9]OGU88362.1 MAG: branched-chain alpha-keto acid dehydrogenase subunit E2 [Ignavibacteria bacterium RIFOXYC12_FULL_35_11]OGU91567.1 MAG: branched-chain alpha-keto acid dehydrogenase subunit E2 [Ignavibacteria bacterium RIFOXYA12_FULL_35_25]OGU97889.1 MAG: branched-chain alpha-keto a